jgi:hypothetical protein
VLAPVQETVRSRVLYVLRGKRAVFCAGDRRQHDATQPRQGLGASGERLTGAVAKLGQLSVQESDRHRKRTPPLRIISP